MADPEVQISTVEAGTDDAAADVEMGVESVEVEETGVANGGDAAEASQEEGRSPPRATFTEYTRIIPLDD